MENNDKKIFKKKLRWKLEIDTIKNKVSIIRIWFDSAKQFFNYFLLLIIKTENFCCSFSIDFARVLLILFLNFFAVCC